MFNKKNSSKFSGARKRAHKRVDKVMDKVENMNERSRKRISRFKEQAVKVNENVQGYIRRNPKKIALAAAGVGAVAGAIFTKKVMGKKK